jgi:outer membrane biosynthesis protein TonB
MAAQQAKVLRVGVIRNGKIVEERVLPARQTITIGTGSQNTIVVPGSGLPVSVPVFGWHGDRCLLAFGPAAQGRIQGPQGEADLQALVAQGLASKAGSGYLVPIKEDQRGKLVLGEVSILWQFVTPAPEAPRPAIPNFGKGSHFQSLDRLFVVILVLSLLVHAAFYLLVVTTPVEHREVTLEEIPDRYAKMIIPEKKEPPKQPEKAPDLAGGEVKTEPTEPQEQKKPDKKKGGDSGPDTPEKKAAHAAAVAKAVQSKGILRVLTSQGGNGSSSLASAFGNSGGPSDVASALAGAGGVVIASGDTAGMGQRKGGGQGGTATIGGLASSGGGGSKVGYGAKTEVKVTGSVAAEAADIDSSEIDQGKLGAFVRGRMGLLKACYENALKRNPGLRGRMRLRFTILETGGLSEVNVIENALGSDVAACVTNTMRAWRMPFRPSGPVTVDYPLVFTPGG